MEYIWTYFLKDTSMYLKFMKVGDYITLYRLATQSQNIQVEWVLQQLHIGLMEDEEADRSPTICIAKR